MAEIMAMSLFAAGYLAITLEHKILVNKAAAGLVLAGCLWTLASLTLPIETVRHALLETGADIFGLIVFLLTAMTLVEILIHYHLFDTAEKWLRNRGWSTYQLAWALAGLVFIFSGLLDNLTTTIVSIQIARRIFNRQEILPVAAVLIITANAGGAFSPIGDITTLMLWFAGKFTASQIILQGFLPSLAMAIIPTWLILNRLPRNAPIECDCPHGDISLSRSDKIIIIATLGAFLLPLFAAAIQLPPYLGLLVGLGLVWMLIDVAKRARPQPTHLGANIKHLLQHTDIESLQFFVGILLAVGALHSLGILNWLTASLLGDAPSWFRYVTTFAGLGIGSAIVDNVPLTAAAISSLPNLSSGLWVLLAIAVGTGGSLLVIGSAAGVVAQGMLPRLTFSHYLRLATFPTLLGFSAAIVVWALQSKLLF